MGKSSAEMSVSPRASDVKKCQVRSSQSLRVPNRRLSVQIQDRPRSADVSKRDDSLTRKISEINNRRSGSFSTRSRPDRSTCSRQESRTSTCTNSNFLQVPEIVVRRPSTDDPDSDQASCPSRDRTPSPFGIERERLPPGSPTFRRAMVELMSESDLSGEDNSNSDDNIVGKDVDKTAKKAQKGQNKSTPSKSKSSSAYKVVRHGKRVNIVRNSKR